MSDGFRLPGREGEPTLAAVLVPLVNRADGLTVLLTQRSADLPDHPGQISFPGGRVEAADADLGSAALRETEEEIGVPRERITLLGYAGDVRNRDRLPRHTGRRLGRAAVFGTGPIRSKSPMCSKCRWRSCWIRPISSATSGCRVIDAATTTPFPTAIATSGARPPRCC